MLPEALLLKISESESQTPFPVMVETLILYFLYEVLREAGLRAPKSLSATVSIVGGLVIGDTAVSAGLVSAPSLMVVALTAIAGYAVPRLYEPLALLRLAFLLAGNFMGGDDRIGAAFNGPLRYGQLRRAASVSGSSL